MEIQPNMQDFLSLVPQPGFCVSGGAITHVNQAAQALLLRAGLEIPPLLHSGQEEYRNFQGGQLYLTLSIGGILRNCVVTRMADSDLFLLDPDSDAEEFRAMELISTELRAPLANAISCAQQLLQQTDSRAPAAASMNRNLLQLMRLVCNLSDVSRYREASHMETRDICAFLEELLEKAGTLLCSKVHLTWELPKEVIPCLIDPEQMERAVWNLLSNAAKFLPAEGTIHVKLTRYGQRLHLSVADNGSGIAEEIRNTVFQRYLRQPGIEDSRFGLGLGMVIIRTAAVNHGGTVLIDRNGDSGTRVTMTLAIRQNTESKLHSPIFRPDYSGGWDHGLMELSNCLPTELYKEI